MIFNSLVPLPFYVPIFYYTLLLLVLLLIIRLITKGLEISDLSKKKPASMIFLVVLVVYIGLRPVSYFFGDMTTYSRIFNNYADGDLVESQRDVFWHYFMKYCSEIMNEQFFFLLCAVLYILPLYFACKNWFGKAMYIPFLMFIASFSFWSYGTNGIRNGIATSFFVWAVSCSNNKILRIALMFVAYLVHASVIIPIGAFVATLFFNKPKYFLIGWLFAIPLSLALGGFWENFFATLGFADDRMSYLTEGNTNEDVFAYTGFRWDFLFYSASAIYAGFYFIIKRKFKDKIYHMLFNIYTLSNAFWILVIRANFSNRFAYLSWFLMAVVIFYPFFKKQFFQNQTNVLIKTVLLYFSFTFVMFLLSN